MSDPNPLVGELILAEIYRRFGVSEQEVADMTRHYEEYIAEEHLADNIENNSCEVNKS